MRLFNLDLHIAVISDVKYILNHLYGSSVEVVNWSISAHNFVLGSETPSVDVVNAGTWRGIDADMVAAFQARYDDFLRGFDGFIVTHTPVFCMLYEKFEKPIILVNSCRYEQPYGWNRDLDGWEWLNNGLRRMAASGQLVAVSNNRADRDYLCEGSGVESKYIPSLCLYTNETYRPVREQFVCFGDRRFFPRSRLLARKPRPGYTWRDLYSFKGIVHIPYEISTMALFEQYSAGVPLWLPSKAYYRRCVLDERMPFQSIYAQVTPAPLVEILNSIDFWLDRADYYDTSHFAGIHYYESREDLLRQLSSFDDAELERAVRSSWLAIRQEHVYAAWAELLAKFVF